MYYFWYGNDIYIYMLSSVETCVNIYRNHILADDEAVSRWFQKKKDQLRRLQGNHPITMSEPNSSKKLKLLSRSIKEYQLNILVTSCIT